jgi:hypothetical protein
MTTPATNSDNVENFGHIQVQSVYLPNNVISATQSSMTYYEDYAHTSNWAGAVTSAATIRLVRRDNEVTLYAKGIDNTTFAASTLTLGTVIPSRFRPSVKFRTSIPVESAAANQQGVAIVDTTGQLTIGLLDAGTTTNMDAAVFGTTASQQGVPSFSLRWHLSVS